MADTVRLALVGCGAIASYHAKAIRSIDRIEIAAAIDPKREAAQALAAEYDAGAFATIEEAAAAVDFDAVDIMTPHDLHESLAGQAFALGKHVLLEKPIAQDLTTAERVLAAGAAADQAFMVGENSQYWPDVVAVERLLRDGAVGEVIAAQAAFECRFDPFWYPGTRPWRFDLQRTGGGVVIDGGAHWIRPLRVWLGEIESVTGTTGRPIEGMDGESLAQALLRFESGVVASFLALTSPANLSDMPWFRVLGTKGEVLIRGGFDAGGVELYDEDHPDGQALPGDHGYFRSFKPELEDFAALVLDGKPPVAPPEQALGEMRTALALYRSARSGVWESVWGA